MVTLITILHVFVCIFLILVVLLQAGKGGGMGMAFGGGSSNTVFGGSGAGNFLTRLTAITAVVFMLTSLLLAYFSSQRGSEGLRKVSEQQAAKAKLDAEQKKALKTIDAGVTAPVPPADELAPTDELPTEETVPPTEPSPAASPSPAKPAPSPAASPSPAKPAASPSPAPTTPAQP
jgi:preprotein translocase subunit SecG